LAAFSTGGQDHGTCAMSAFKDLNYVGCDDLRVAVGHPTDDPYRGRPRSSRGTQMLNQGPKGVEWEHSQCLIRKSYEVSIQAALTQDDRLILIACDCRDLDIYRRPNNGLVLNADGSVHRQILAPDDMRSNEYRGGTCPIPYGLVSVDSIGSTVAIAVAFWQGDFEEQREYDPESGRWGDLVGHYIRRR
jgi:hypothetical protein